MDDYKELKRLAEAATPGPWIEQDDEDSAAGAVFITPMSDRYVQPICRITHEFNAAFVAAANPAAVLELIAERDQLKAENEILYAQLEKYASDPSGSKVAACGSAADGSLRGSHIFSDSAKSPSLDKVFKLFERAEALGAENEALRKALTCIRDTSDDWHVCEKAADALTDSSKEAGHAPVHHTSYALVHEPPPICSQCGRKMFTGLIPQSVCNVCEEHMDD